MKDLISREALLKNAQRMTEYDEAGWGVPVRVVKVEHIENAPAVDAVEVKHGRWERGNKFKPYCTACGKDPLSAIIPEGNLSYCPNCGARMDGE